MRRWFSRAVVGYLILALGVVGGFVLAGHDRAESRRRTCVALRQSRVDLAKVVDVAIPPLTARQPEIDPALDPALRKLIEDSRARSATIRRDIGRRLAEPIALCDGTGIDPAVRLALGWP